MKTIFFININLVSVQNTQMILASLLNDNILTGIDNGMLTGMILIDLQKVFDTTDHEIFFSKMVHFGFSQATIFLYRSYLTNRTFLVNVGKNLSSPGDRFLAP